MKRMTIKSKIIVAYGLLCSPLAFSADNVAYSDANVRFTVISDGAVRMEYSPDGKFFNGKSFIAVKRDYPKAEYQVKDTKEGVVISTAEMVLSYKKDGQPFSTANLSIISAPGAPLAFSWHPGTENKGNLKGTYHTLDGYNGNLFENNPDRPMPLEEGLLSTEGWTLIDDSKGYAFDDSDWAWVSNRDTSAEATDWYFLAYGHDYKQALNDFTLFSGKVPLPPRYAFGYWWSRYWHYSDNDYRDLVKGMQEYNIPMDVLVVDMDWHYISDGLGDWTGYTWSRRLFPDPAGMIKWIHGNNLKVTLNLHPANGIRPFEEHYSEMAAHMGVTAQADTMPTIEWEASSKKFMTGWVNTQLKPLERQGVDFWWLDWQQWSKDKNFPALSNIWWINYVTYSDMERTRPERPMIYHRWGGLGNHRYQIGFSGDSYISWESLDFLPYFNSTASNVLYGYWSHDIGGHWMAPSIDPELYVRWMQFGMVNPILRTHSSKSTTLNKEPWMFDHEHSKILRQTIRSRYALVPYIYTMARQAYDTGVSLCRPMYYDYPENEESYQEKNQYMFGDNILVAPITEAMTDGISTKEVWLPEGDEWWEMSTGSLLAGGQKLTRDFLLDEYPWYAKGGSILPMYADVKNLQGNDGKVEINIIPTAKENHSSRFVMYEDNGNDKEYDTRYATTLLTSEKRGNLLKVTINPAKGDYDGMPHARDFAVKVRGSVVPVSVKVNGKETDYDFDGNELALSVSLPGRDLHATDEVEITYPEDAPCVTDGLAGRFRRIHNEVFKIKQADAEVVLTEDLAVLESTGLALGYYPAQFNERLARFNDIKSRLRNVLETQQRFPAEKIPYFLRIAD